MKTCAPFIFLFLVQSVFAQKHVINYSSIDWNVKNIDASSPAELAQDLTASCKTSLEKTRAIFSWIAQHISYEYKRAPQNSKPVQSSDHSGQDNADSSTELLPLNDLVAEDVLKKRTALCYGYTRLFKCLCDHAGITCEIINGYGRGDFHKVGNNFRTNHAWNAVLIDSSWYLVDVTWASGYFTYNSNQFVQHFDDHYFLTPPEQFALDHFPDDLKWSLLQQPPTIGEFIHSPYKGRCFIKYNITSYWPVGGIIHASVGDTVNLNVQADLPPDRNIGGGSNEDTSNLAMSPIIVYCKPAMTGEKNLINYTYIIQSAGAQWLQLVYNDDMILRYRLDIKQKE